MKVIELLFDYKGSETWVNISDRENNIILDGTLDHMLNDFMDALLFMSVYKWDIIQIYDTEKNNIIVLEIIINEHISKKRIC